MKVKELLEFNDEENPRDYPNPLPSIEAGSPEFGKFDDAASEVENLIVYLYKKENNIEGMLQGKEYGNVLTQGRKKYGEVVDFPIDKLTAAEPTLDKKHLDMIMQGKSTKAEDDLPTVYKVGNKNYVGDGNHRVAAASLQGNQTVKVLFLDVDKLKKSLTSLVK